MSDYPAPTIDALINGELDPTSQEETVKAVVQRSKAWHPKVLALYMNDQVIDPTYPAPNNDRSAQWLIPTTMFLAYAGQQVKVYYTLDGVSSEALVFNVKEEFGAPQRVDLSDKNYIVFHDASNNAFAPSSPPGYAQLSRRAMDAAAYSSSSAELASVDASGKVTLIGNTGEQPVTITALDSESKPVGSYELSIRGIRELAVLGSQPVDLKGALDQLSIVPGFELPSADDFDRFKALYGEQLSTLLHGLGLPEEANKMGFLGSSENAGKLTFLRFAGEKNTPGPIIKDVDDTQQGYAVGITHA